MLCVTYKPFMLSTIMLHVIMLSVVAPLVLHCWHFELTNKLAMLLMFMEVGFWIIISWLTCLISRKLSTVYFCVVTVVYYFATAISYACNFFIMQTPRCLAKYSNIKEKKSFFLSIFWQKSFNWKVFAKTIILRINLFQQRWHRW